MTRSRTRNSSTLGKVFLPIFIILILVIGSLYLIKSQIPHSQKAGAPIEIQVGNTLPDFTLTLLDGSQVKISDIHSKVFLINFWATWCEACMSEMPSLVQLRNTFVSRGFEVLAINLDESPEGVVPKTIRQFKMEFPVYKDSEGHVAELFDVHAIPLTVIIDDHRKILFVKDGEENWNGPLFHSQLQKWLSG